MKRAIGRAALAAGLAVAFVAGAAQAAPAYVRAAIDDKNRPAADVQRDAARKPADMIMFAGIHPGEKVLELIPGGGYFERLFSVAVGPNGHLYEAVPVLPGAADASPKSNGIARDPHYANITEFAMNPANISGDAPYDVIWTSQNYHDLHLTRLHFDIAGFDKLLFASLGKGGTVVIVDHAARPGSGTSDTDKEHRIDEDLVKREMKDAGFVLVAESNVLRNPADDHSLLVFDPKIRGHTDQFVLKWRKP
ncbi:MAG TPA: methyltransferase [Caulobacteraceae bacterium]|nr:methyltransferase [Caulobacteraceae bacterium]